MIEARVSFPLSPVAIERYRNSSSGSAAKGGAKRPRSE